MKKKSISMIVLSLLLIVSLMNVSALASSTGTTTAKVAFTEGAAEFGDAELAGLGNMNIDFGSRNLPIGAQNYEAVDNDHTLRIIDARSGTTAGDWDVSVALSTFSSTNISPANTFIGTITLNAPSSTFGLTSPSPLAIIGGASAINAVTAVAGLTKNNFDTTWQMSDVTLSFDAAAAATITEPDDYTATLTWTLTVH